MTRAALKADRSLAMDIKSRHDIAWSAIAEALCAADEPPGRQELIRVGWQAIYREVRDTRRQRGYPDDGYGDYDVHHRPRFAAYWHSMTYTPSPENQIVNRLAVNQIMAVLKPIDLESITALAVHSDYDRAAESLGISYRALTVRLTTARRRTIGLWHEGETPRARWTDRRVEVRGKELDTHCHMGHEWTPENTRVRRRTLRGRPHKSRVCLSCERDRGARRSLARTHAKASR